MFYLKKNKKIDNLFKKIMKFIFMGEEQFKYDAF